MKRRFLFALTFALSLVLALCGAACTKEIKLTFETNGGTPVEEIVAEAGGEVELPKTSKTGYAFDGWYTKADFSGESYEGTVPSPEKSTKYYAKWTTGYEVKLETDGGSLTTTSVWLKEGASVYDAVQDLVPQKGGLSFGAWFMGETELSRSYRMPAETVTLTAKYKAEYIIQLYLQNLGRTSYQRADEYETTGSGYVNTPVSPAAPAVTGYAVQPAPENGTPVTTLTLKENAEENIFSFYYDRRDYTVFYDGNPPAGTAVSGDTPYDTVIFGGTATVQACGFSVKDYRFAGWAESADGEVVYQPGATLKIGGGVTLFAVWDRGYTDRFGSDDLIFFPRTDPAKAVLLRNGKEFEGTRQGNVFSFTTDAGETFGGSVVGSGFSYARPDLAGTYIFYDNYPRPAGEDYQEEDRYDDSRTLEVDAYLGAVYTEKGIKTTGSLLFSASQGDYVFTSDDGGTSFHTLFRKPAAEGTPAVFSVGGGEFGYYVDSRGEELLLDGYGTAFLVIATSAGNSELQGYYYLETGEMQLAYGEMNSYKVVCFLNDTTGILGNGQGWNTFYLCVLPDYWDTLGAEYGFYVFADTARGTYENGSETLVLDGHGYYLDSAVYTDKDGNTLKGGYEITVDFVSGSIVDLVDGDGNPLKSFRLSSDGFFTVYNGPEVKYTEYYLIEGESMQPIMLAIFEEEYNGMEGTKRAEFYANNSKNVGVHAASGYVTSAPIQEGYEMLLYTFTRTSAEYGFEDSMPLSMKFTVTRTSPTNSSVWYNCYSVLEENGISNYQVIELPGGIVWANETVIVDGEGSVYFKDGKASYCSFPISTDEFFGETYGELLDSGTGGGEGQLFKLTPSAKSGVEYEAAPVAGLPTTFFYFDPMLSPENGPFENLVLTPDGKACYDEENKGEWKDKGIYRPVAGKKTIFGTQVYELVFGESVRFEFVQGTLHFLGSAYPAYFLSVGKEGAYSTEGGTFTLDGYGNGRYSSGGVTLSGSYYFMTDNILRLTVPDDDEDSPRYDYEFELDGENFRPLHDCYGTWALVDGNFQPLNNFSSIYFDGKDTFTITELNGAGNRTQGKYELYDAEHGEYVLYQATIDGKKGNYFVRFMEYAEWGNYNCVVRDVTAGVYVDENYNVLSVNGFGSGTLKGNTYNSTGNFYLIDGDLGFAYFLFTGSDYNEEIVHVILNYDDGTFRILEGSGYYTDYIYFASDLDHVAFRSDGAVFLGNLLNGDYLYTENGVNVYIYEQELLHYVKYEIPMPGGATYTYTLEDGEKDGEEDGESGKEEKIYYRYDGETFTAEGKIELLGADGTKTGEKEASLAFAIRYRSIVGFDTTFTIDGKEYGEFSLYSYTDGEINPRIVSRGLVYNIDFAYTQSGGWTFTVTDAGVRQYKRDDVNIAYGDGPAQSGTIYHQGGRITFTYNSFGSYEIGETVYDGRFLYFYNESQPNNGVLEFHGIKDSEIRTVGYYDLGTAFGGYHNLREILFEQDGKKYAIDFFEYSTGSVVITYSFMLNGFYEYEEVEAGEYTLGVKYLLYANLAGSPGNGDPNAIGKPIAVTVFDSAKEPIVAVTSGTRYEDKGVWFVENKNGRAGDAFLVDFVYDTDNPARVRSGSVHKGSVQTVGLPASYLFYMFVDEEGNLGEIMSARYANIQFDSVTEVKQDGLVWTFTGREDAAEPLRKYTLTFSKSASGNYTVRVESEIIKTEA